MNCLSRYHRLQVFAVFICSLFWFSAHAQETIKGRLVDSETGASIPFATIKLQNRMIGVISNSEGDFQLPLKFQAMGDAIEITCIGYVKKTQPLSQLRESELNIIRISPSTTQLNEVTIRSKKWAGLTAYKIVELAIDHIPDNYPQQPYSYAAYYRDYQVKEEEYINLNEAIVHIADSGFQTNDQLATRILLSEYRKNSDFKRDSTTEVPYDNKPSSFTKSKNKFIPNAFLFPFGGNELSILRVHDAIRNYRAFSYSFVGQLNEDFVNNHFFTLKGTVLLNDVPLYAIEFESKISASGNLHTAKGKIYIEKSNFAIHKLEYACYNKTMRETLLMYDIQLEYAKHNNQMYLNYISFNNSFKVRNERDFRIISVDFDRVANAFIINFNNTPDVFTAGNKSNYDFKFNDSPLLIQRVDLNQTTKQAVICLDEKERGRFMGKDADLSAQLKFNIVDVRDIDNRQLDKVTLTSLQQFRELFVQQINGQELPFAQSSFQKDKPLSKNIPESVGVETDRYWMNSPLHKKGR